MRGQHQQAPWVHSDVCWKSSVMFTHSCGSFGSKPLDTLVQFLVFFSLHFQYFSELRKWFRLEPKNWLIPSQDSHVHTHKNAAETQFNTITRCINKAVMVLGSPWLWLVHTHTLIRCQGCQAKSWLWGSLWQDSIIFGLCSSLCSSLDQATLLHCHSVNLPAD